MRLFVVGCCLLIAACSSGAATGGLQTRTSQVTPGPVALGHYAIRDVESVLRLQAPQDGAGIVMATYDGRSEYNPVTVAQYALGYYGRWLDTGSSNDRGQFFLLADWLVRRQEPGGLWLYTFAYAGMPVPWVSAMAEGQGISVLVRAYGLTGDEKYRRAARLALDTFRRRQGDGGVMVTEGGYVYYEEYMPPYSPHTLNGFIFALIGAWDYQQAFHDDEARAIFDVGVATLAANLGKWDTTEWSRYNLASSGYTASLSYHLVHIGQLRELYALTGNDVFRRYADQWSRYARSVPSYVQRDCTIGIDCPS
jgi:heparosan-N-sulfate-glucuronate 5-epimerase